MKNKIKRPVYLFCAIIFGIFLAILLWGLVELNFVKMGVENFWAAPAFLAAWLILGALFGFWVGRIWWRLVYVEHRHWRNDFRREKNG